MDACFGIAEVNVPLHEETLDETHSFHSDDERDRNQVTHDNHPSTTIGQCVDQDLNLELLRVLVHNLKVEC